MAFPRVCCLCGEIAGDFFTDAPQYFDGENGSIKSPFCSQCTKELQNSFGLRKRKRKISNLDSFFIFDYSHDAVRNLLFHIKRCDCKRCFRFSANLLDHYLNAMTRDGSSITVLPRNYGNFKRYGFDQSQKILGQYLTENYGKKYVHIFSRKENIFSAQQKNLTPAMRLENAKETLVLVAGTEIPGKLVIFDDMVTTGATANVACELVLEKMPDCEIKLIFLAGQDGT